MNITKELREYLVRKFSMAADATDEVARQLVASKLASGELKSKKLDKFTSPKSVDPEAMIAAAVTKALAAHQPVPVATTPVTAPVVTTPAAKETDADVIAKAVATELEKRGLNDNGNPYSVYARAAAVLNDTIPSVRVKSAVEQYSTSTKAAICPATSSLGTPHPMAGRPAEHAGVMLDEPSERAKAISAAYFKWALLAGSGEHVRDIPRGLRMTEHDHEIMKYALHECKWTGLINGNDDDVDAKKVNRTKLTDLHRKALLDDSTSGGIEIAPIEFDDAVILTPVLYGELYPRVNVINVTRGRRMKGGALTNPTLTWGVAEGTAIQTFNTSALVGAFDTGIYTVTGAMEIGLDFEEDSPTAIGQWVIQQYGLKFQEQLDYVIANGDGVTQPQGVFGQAATIVVNSDNGTLGYPTVSDYESCLFGVAKAFRQAKGARGTFVGNEVSYRRARAIAVGAGDERRVFGMTHADYKVFDAPYAIQVNIPNNQYGYVNWGGYRAYRRLGLNIRIESAGNYLALKNLKLIVLRARFGGQLELGGYAALVKDGML